MCVRRDSTLLNGQEMDQKEYAIQYRVFGVHIYIYIYIYIIIYMSVCVGVPTHFPQTTARHQPFLQPFSMNPNFNWIITYHSRS